MFIHGYHHQLNSVLSEWVACILNCKVFFEILRKILQDLEHRPNFCSSLTPIFTKSLHGSKAQCVLEKKVSTLLTFLYPRHISILLCSLTVFIVFVQICVGLIQCTGHPEHLMWTPSRVHEVRETMKETWPILPLRNTRCCLDTYVQCLKWRCFIPTLYSMPDSKLQCVWSVSWSWGILDRVLNIPGSENSPLKG